MLKILFTGDVSLTNIDVNNFRIQPDLEAIYNDCDLRVCNLEAPFTNGESHFPNQAWYMKASPIDSNIIQSFDVFSLANNHILDYCESGLKDTTAFLESLQKKWFGIGSNLKKSLQPLLLERNRHKLAFFGVTSYYNAGENSAGTSSLYSKQIIKQIRKYKKQGYFIILYPHWNYEFTDYPAPLIRRLSFRYIDAGVDIIIGSHPHVIQGYEIYKNKHIFHSLGNLIFHSSQFVHKSDQRLYQTFGVQIIIDENSNYQTEIIPITNSDESIRLMVNSEKDDFMHKLTQISETIRTSEYPDAFYSQASTIISRSLAAIKKADKQNSLILGILKRLHKISLQDILIELYMISKKIIPRS